MTNPSPSSTAPPRPSSGAPPAPAPAPAPPAPPPSAFPSNSLDRRSSVRNPFHRWKQSVRRPLSAVSLSSAPPTSSTRSSVAFPPSSSSPYHPKTTATPKSEDWSAPTDQEGTLVRATYQHFSTHPVKGDGRVAGTEMTRHKGGINGYGNLVSAHRTNRAAVSDLNIPSPTIQVIPTPGQSYSPVLTHSVITTEAGTMSAARSVGRRHPGTQGIQPGRLSPRPPHVRVPYRSDARSGTTGGGTTTGSETLGIGRSDLGRSTSDSYTHSAMAATTLLEPPSTPKSPSPPSASRTPRHVPSTTSSQVSPAASRTSIDTRTRSESSVSTYPVPTSSSRPEPGEDLAAAEDPELDATGMVKPTDPYGFFQLDTEGKLGHGRALALPSRVYNKLPHRPRIEAIRSDGRLGASNSARPSGTMEEEDQEEEPKLREARSGLERRRALDSRYRNQDPARSSKWATMLVTVVSRQAQEEVHFKDNVTPGALRRRVFKGIPDSWRPVVWPLLLRLRASSSIATTSTTTSSHSNSSSSELAQHFAQLQTVPSQYDVQIDLDVPRTMNGHQTFFTRYGQGQVQLFQVLHAISLYSECGYCQGMGPIAATFLLQLPNPALAYSALTTLHDH